VEIFFNLLWVTVTIALAAIWLASHHRGTRSRLSPALGVQLTAFLVLALVLLPVISLTDDLQTQISPAETEHVARRGDLQPAPDQRLHSLPVALTLLVTLPKIPSIAVRESVAAEQLSLRQVNQFYRAFATRPPPAATSPV
jgi:hypothetical protein